MSERFFSQPFFAVLLSRPSLRLLLGAVCCLFGHQALAAPALRGPYLDREQQCRPQPFPAVVLHLAGEAWKLDAKGKQVALEEGMNLEEHEGVRTSGDAFVSLRLGDGSRIVLPSNSQVRLELDETQSVPQVQLEQGQVESYVIKRISEHDRFQIRTSVGVLGVRGTHFRTRSEDGQALVEVLDGQVAVSRADAPQAAGNKARSKVAVALEPAVRVNARQGLKIQGSGELKPVDLLAAPRLLGQDGQRGDKPVWQLFLQPLDGARRYRAQVATDADFLNIKQERFSSTPDIRFSGLQAAFYHVRLSAFDEQGLEGQTGVYDIYYWPRMVHEQ
ncbi:FecR domain-containing protein [Pseudomonas gingeri]|uniref:FecR family protein n=1 Tax=Pseudomonas gingeri TaxID=117681 RepID=UPI0015A25B88|nr:FecR domain-containing protein [Pseudomonas gingeri]NWD77558.1 FecR domain-containing protein [Pseudomonas gingeri]